MTLDPNNPAPGRYDGVDIDTYGRAKGVRRSELAKLIDGTGLDLAFYRNNGTPDSAALRIGSATDDLVFDRDNFDRVYAVMPKFDMRRKADKEARAEWEDANAGKRWLTHDEHELSRTLADAILCSKAVKAVLDGAAAQPSIWWKHETVSGREVLVKTRPDAYIESRARSIDLKTTKSLKDHDIASSMWSFNYAIQVAMFHEGIKAAGYPMEQHAFIWVDKNPPHDVRVTPMSIRHRWFEIGEAAFEYAIDRYAEIEAAEDYSGFSGKASHPPAIPVWVAKEEERLNELLNKRRAAARKTA